MCSVWYIHVINFVQVQPKQNHQNLTLMLSLGLFLAHFFIRTENTALICFPTVNNKLCLSSKNSYTAQME